MLHDQMAENVSYHRTKHVKGFTDSWRLYLFLKDELFKIFMVVSTRQNHKTNLYRRRNLAKRRNKKRKLLMEERHY